MKGHVQRRGKTFRYMFDGVPDPLTGERRQITKGGFKDDKEAWEACHKAIADYQAELYVPTDKKTVKQMLDEWMTRRQHSIKPSMAKNYRNYANYYVFPYIGDRQAQRLNSAVFDALYNRLLSTGRCKKNSAAGEGLAPKTVVNVHRMLHRAWEDFVKWRYVKRNVVAEASPPRVPRRMNATWSPTQLSTFLHTARTDRFFALWVLEATTGMRRCELAGARRNHMDLDAGTLELGPTRVVIDGQVVESDGKSATSCRTIALDAYTVAILQAYVEELDREKAEWGMDYHETDLLFCWSDGRAPHPDTFTSRFGKLADRAGLPRIRLHDVRHSYVTAGRRARVDSKALSKRVGHASVSFTMATYMHGDQEADREVADLLAAIILAGLPDVPAPKERG